MDSISNDFSQLSVGDLHASSQPTTSQALKRVTLHRDVFTDDDHKPLDAKILKGFSAFRDMQREPGLPLLLSTITVDDKRLTTLTTDEAEELLTQETSIAKVLGNAWHAGSFKEVRQLHILWPQMPPASDTRLLRESSASLLEVPIRASAIATELSWNQPFVGNAAEALWSHIKEHHHRYPSGVSVYAQYAAIVQSSGMGKSRTVDEMGKRHLVIPINVRQPQSQGFPASDVEVHRFLTNPDSREDALLRAHCFLTSLFIETALTIRHLRATTTFSDEGLPDTFRVYMTEGQKMHAHNAKRKNFYGNVVERANEMLNHEKRAGYDSTLIGDPDQSPLPKLHHQGNEITVTSALDDLIRVILDEEDGSPSPSPMPPSTRTSARFAEKQRKSKEHSSLSKFGDPVIVLAFDEAHTLIDFKNMDNNLHPWSAFSQLRRALRSLNEYRLFSLFLSTTGKMTQFSSAPGDDSSTRVQIGQLYLIMPFTDLGFDQVAAKIAVDGSLTLEDVAVIGHMVTLGRPLFALRYLHATEHVVKERLVRFAGEKLLNGSEPLGPLTEEQELACLSQRMPIEFYSTTYSSRKKEQHQVESHMRVCLKVLPGFEHMVTISPSEPILSEAASDIMSKPNFNAPKALQHVFGGFAVHRGDRGEFVVMLLLTLSRDKAVLSRNPSTANHRVFLVNHFLTALFTPAKKILSMLPSVARPKDAKSSFATTFHDARLHFNHFIKVHQHRMIKRKFLVWFMTRGAAVLCGNSQAGIDGILPYLFEGSRLHANNVGGILWQAKAGGEFSDIPVPALFDAMDPFQLGIFDKDDVSHVVPLIRVVFVLGAGPPSVKVLPLNTAQTSYTSYDIWCSGVSSDCLAQVEKVAEDTWESLVLASHGWQDIYDASDRQTKALRMSMNPGAAANTSFWSAWSSP